NEVAENDNEANEVAENDNEAREDETGRAIFETDFLEQEIAAGYKARKLVLRHEVPYEYATLELRKLVLRREKLPLLNKKPASATTTEQETTARTTTTEQETTARTTTTEQETTARTPLLNKKLLLELSPLILPPLNKSCRLNSPIRIVSHYMDVHSSGVFDDTNIHFIRKEVVKEPLPPNIKNNQEVDTTQLENIVSCVSVANAGFYIFLSMAMEANFRALNLHARAHGYDILDFIKKVTALVKEDEIWIFLDEINICDHIRILGRLSSQQTF
ncbi:4776_t:CDS:2, partial [Racocetra persica]